jgi:hypothetical protein
LLSKYTTAARVPARRSSSAELAVAAFLGLQVRVAVVAATIDVVQIVEGGRLEGGAERRHWRAAAADAVAVAEHVGQLVAELGVAVVAQVGLQQVIAEGTVPAGHEGRDVPRLDGVGGGAVGFCSTCS